MTGTDAGVDAGPLCGCEAWGNGRNDGTFSSPVTELSGLVASRAHPGVFYGHNDSGDIARFFALTQAAKLTETFELTGGAVNVDWEDVGIGPCASGTCIFIGDVGDNLFNRADYAIYAVPEPKITGGTVTLSTWQRFAFQYPQGGKRNSEAIFVHPTSGQVYVITKEDSGFSQVFKLPLPMDSGALATLDLVATLTLPTATDRPITGADVNACGTAVLMRMYNRLVEYRLPAGETNFDAIFSTEPFLVPSASEDQSEAVAYSADGRTYFTSSEKLLDPPPLYEYRCR